MPSSSNGEFIKLTLSELIELRRAILPPSKATPLSLADRFLVPPFSVLDARQGYWQTRKRMWLALEIKSELGRVGDPGGSLRPATTLGKDGKTVRGDGHGKPLARTFGSGGPGDLAEGFKQKTLGAIAPNQGGSDGILTSPGKYATNVDNRAIKDHAWLATHGKRIPQAGIEQPPTSTGAEPLYGAYREGATDDVSSRIAAAQPQSGTSIFDPVLCELVYRWFTPPNGQVFDPFAGGSVRGIVATKLGRKYCGIDLRPEQAEANETQATEITPDNKPTWVVGDACNTLDFVRHGKIPKECDMVFSCPPYFDLEKYSDDDRDLSSMTYEGFLEAYQAIIADACSLLCNNRFACFVVGDIRDKDGLYRSFVADTVDAFKKAGLGFYNEMILVTAVGSLSIRVGRQFSVSRKVGKTHQQVLVFIKGNAKIAVEACGKVDMNDLDMPPCLPDSVAICRQDVDTKWVEYLVDDGCDASVVNLPLVEACLLCDVVRGQARESANTTPRAWVSTINGWSLIEDDDELTYINADKPYMRRVFFPNAEEPASSSPQPIRLR